MNVFGNIWFRFLINGNNLSDSMFTFTRWGSCELNDDSGTNENLHCGKRTWTLQEITTLHRKREKGIVFSVKIFSEPPILVLKNCRKLTFLGSVIRLMGRRKKRERKIVRNKVYHVKKTSRERFLMTLTSHPDCHYALSVTLNMILCNKVCLLSVVFEKRKRNKILLR